MSNQNQQWTTELVDNLHDRKPFDCGNTDLNEYLRKRAIQHMNAGYGRTYVACSPAHRVVGFYTISMSRVIFQNIPESFRRGMPRYPMPVALIGQLGVCASHQGKRLGEFLLMDALARCCQAAEIIGARAIEVDASDDTAKKFYVKYGFEPFTDHELHLFMPIATARESLGL